MSILSKPLYSLTVEEFSNLNKELFCEVLADVMNEFESKNNVKEPLNEIIFLEDVMKLTGYKKATIYSKVCRFEIPVLSKRKPLTFSRSKIIEWMESGKPSIIDLESDNYLKR